MFDSFRVEIPNGEARLAAEMLLPEAALPPVVLFAPSSGLADSDGNDTDVGFAPLQQLAEGLAERGFRSLRFDRSGLGRSTGEVTAVQGATEDFAVVRQFCRQQPELQGPLVLLSHGEGAALAVLSAQAEPVAALILIAPPVSYLNDLLGFQAAAEQALSASDPEQHRQVLAQLQQEYASKTHLFLLRPVLSLNLSLLAVHGEMDWVFPTHEVRLLEQELYKQELYKSGQAKFTSHILPELDHWLVRTDHWRSAQENLLPHWQVDSAALDLIAHWLKDLA
ncbi:alpha/beta hydrolase [Leptolyngbya sp. FACHB-261]|uniref:alpha/beta hydrolase n=1 Tax=Leptolyngbya sp. FACHB-261 TaxID=2692806 RepID=UPI0016879185|nr:alpha/beta fold hydrolase [Leptolyngbya sp. FACHB-261]MBD2103321.1 alpha/beta fold hydrolase [Leptolyngbya sp. FACHB-261]